MTPNPGFSAVVDEFLRDDPDCPVFGFNLACAYPFPEIAAQFYRPIARSLAAFDPAVYVYPDWETHVTIVTFAKFSLHRRPGASRLEELQLLLQRVARILEPALAARRSFPLTIRAPDLTPKAAILPIDDASGEVSRVRHAVEQAVESDRELHDTLLRAGLNVPGIVHSTVARFKAAPADPGKFFADFYKAVRDVRPVQIVISELLLTTETKPYMREGAVVRRFPLAPI